MIPLFPLNSCLLRNRHCFFFPLSYSKLSSWNTYVHRQCFTSTFYYFPGGGIVQLAVPLVKSGNASFTRCLLPLSYFRVNSSGTDIVLSMYYAVCSREAGTTRWYFIGFLPFSPKSMNDLRRMPRCPILYRSHTPCCREIWSAFEEATRISF